MVCYILLFILLGQEVVFLCRDEGLLRAQVTWERGNGRPLPPGSRINITEGRLEIPNIQVGDCKFLFLYSTICNPTLISHNYIFMDKSVRL